MPPDAVSVAESPAIYRVDMWIKPDTWRHTPGYWFRIGQQPIGYELALWWGQFCSLWMGYARIWDTSRDESVLELQNGLPRPTQTKKGDSKT